METCLFSPLLLHLPMIDWREGEREGMLESSSSVFTTGI